MTDASAFLDSVSQQLDQIGQEGLTKRERLISGIELHTVTSHFAMEAIEEQRPIALA